MTWKELKEFCDSLDEKQLQSKVIVWREDECISRLEPITLSEDYYNDPESFDPSCFPETEAKQMVVDNIDYPNGMDDLIHNKLKNLKDFIKSKTDLGTTNYIMKEINEVCGMVETEQLHQYNVSRQRE